MAELLSPAIVIYTIACACIVSAVVVYYGRAAKRNPGPVIEGHAREGRDWLPIVRIGKRSVIMRELEDWKALALEARRLAEESRKVSEEHRVVALKALESASNWQHLAEILAEDKHRALDLLHQTLAKPQAARGTKEGA